MSNAAGEYFLSQATEFGIMAPPILNGEAMVLVDPATRLSIHLADSIDHQKLPGEIWTAARDQVAAIGGYLLEVAQKVYPGVDYVDSGSTRLRTGRQPAAGFLDAFTPAQKKLKTGHLRNFLAEVVMPDEIPENIREDFMSKVTGHNRQLTDFSAVLLTTAELYSGKPIGRLGNISCIAVTGHGKATDSAPFTRILRPPLSVSRPLSTNDVLAVMALQESRAIAHEATSQAMRRPYRGGLM